MNPNERAKMKKRIKEATADVVNAIAVMKALVEMESPEWGEILLEVMQEQLDKMKPVEKIPAGIKKAMLSQPMACKTEEEIKETRERAIATLTEKGFFVVNTLFTDEWYGKEAMERRGVVQIPLCFLAKSLENMSLCHAAYFCEGWEQARGCRIEHEAAVAYGLEIIYEE